MPPRDPLGITPRQTYDPYANPLPGGGYGGGYVEEDDPVAAARATLARADRFASEVGLDEPAPRPAKAKGALRGITEAMAGPALPLGLASVATGLSGIGAPLSLPLGAAGAMFAAPDVLRRLVMPEEDEGRTGAAIEGGLSMLPVAGSALRGIRSIGQGAKAASKVGPSLDDVLRGVDMFDDAGSRAGGLATRTGDEAISTLPESFKPFSTPEALSATKMPKPSANPMGYSTPRTFEDDIASLANEGVDTLGYSTPGFWQQSDNMFEQAQKAVPFDDMARYAKIRNNPKAKQALLDASRDARGLPRLGRGVGMLDEAVPLGDEVDLSLETMGGPTEAARRAQDLARRFRSNRPSTEF